MSQNVLLAVYAVIGTIALYLTVQRVLAGVWLGALFSGAITAFCVYRLYTVLNAPSDSS
jgi:4-amino-4-deoxy-L-arabinose transferase-like glycosyltransferase